MGGNVFHDVVVSMDRVVAVSATVFRERLFNQLMYVLAFAARCFHHALGPVVVVCIAHVLFGSLASVCLGHERTPKTLVIR